MLRRLPFYLAMSLLVLSGCRSDDKDPPVKTDGSVSGDGSVVKSDGGVSPDASTVTTETTIYKINDGTTTEGTNVVLKEVVVSAVDQGGQYTGDVYVQEANGGPGSGLKLFNPKRVDGGDIKDLKPGDRVRVEGAVKYFSPSSTPFANNRKVKEIEAALVTYLAPGTAPTPAAVPVADLLKDPTAAGWEGVLVSVSTARVNQVDDQYGEFELDGGLEVDDELFFHQAKVGDCVNVTGILFYFYAYKLAPRSAADIGQASGCKQPKPTTIKDIQEGGASAPQDGDLVTVAGVVSAVDSRPTASNVYYGFWLQDGTGPFSGIYVYHSWTDKTAVKPVEGDTVEVTATYSEFKGLSELSNAYLTVKSAGGTAPTPEVIADPATIATGGKDAEKYEGVLVKIQNVEVDQVLKTTNNTVVGFDLKVSKLRIENDLHDFMQTPPATGTKYSEIVGVLHYSFDAFKLMPRTAKDLVKQ